MKWAALFFLFCCAAQPEFEAASVKPSSKTAADGARKLSPGPASLAIAHESLRDIIEWAYGLHDRDELSGPGWIDDDEYDIVARTATPVSTDQLRAMLRALLQQRFGLESHREQQTKSVYALKVAKDGSKLTASTGDPNGRLNLLIGPGSMTFRHTPMTTTRLAEELAKRGAVDRPVVDKTGLKGVYDFDLTFACAIQAQPGEVFHGCSDGESTAPNVFKAVDQQLGLRLDSDKAAVDIVIIDRIERTVKGN